MNARLRDYRVIVRVLQQPSGQERRIVRTLAGSVGEARREALRVCADEGLRVRDILAAGLA
jgi:hypothetical protein